MVQLLRCKLDIPIPDKADTIDPLVLMQIFSHDETLDWIGRMIKFYFESMDNGMTIRYVDWGLLLDKAIHFKERNNIFDPIIVKWTKNKWLVGNDNCTVPIKLLLPLDSPILTSIENLLGYIASTTSEWQIIY